MKEKKVDFSIDKLTVLGTFKSCFYYDEVLNLFLYNYAEFSKRKYIDNQFFSFSFIIEDLGFLQIDESTLKFRLEFNPNKLSSFTKLILNQLLSYITDYHFSRIDLAIDLYNYDLYNYNIIDVGRRKKAYYYDSIGKLETCYFGSMSSNKFIRIYNKAKEQKLLPTDDNADWWRIELQLRDDNIDLYLTGFKDFLKDVFIFKYISTDVFDSSEKAILEYILKDIHRLNEFNKNTRTKYRKIIRCLELDSLDFINDFMRYAYINVLEYLQKLCPGVYLQN